MGVPPSGSGCQPSASAAVPASSQSGIPNALIEAIEFYAFPENWHGVYMVGRGPMTDDWSDDYDDPQYPDGKPGKRARDCIRWLYENGHYDELRAEFEPASGIKAGTAETAQPVRSEGREPGPRSGDAPTTPSPSEDPCP